MISRTVLDRVLVLRLAHTALEGSVPGEVDPGGAMLFDGRTWHTALPNHSERDRETLTIRYVPSSGQNDVMR